MSLVLLVSRISPPLELTPLHVALCSHKRAGDFKPFEVLYVVIICTNDASGTFVLIENIAKIT